MKNPFTNRSAITRAEDFFGRKWILDSLLGRLVDTAKPQCVALVGQRRIGKSSLFRRLMKLIVERDAEVAAAYYDLEAARKLTADWFFQTITRRLAKASDRKPTDDSEEPPFDILQEFLEDAEADGRRFVLLLDEFDTVTSNPAFDADFFGSLRYLVNNYPLAFVTSSYEDLTELCHAEEIKQSPFFNVFTQVNLGVMQEDEVEHMLDTLVERGGIPFDAPERTFIRKTGGSFPFFVQIAAAAVWEAHRQGLPATGEEVERSFLEEAEPHFRYFVEHLSHEEQKALEAVVRGREAPARAGRRLERRSLVRVDGAAHEPFTACFGEYVEEWARRWQTSDEDTDDSTLSIGVATPVRPVLLGQRFRLDREIGQGGFGTVYLAWDQKLERPVALKMLRKDEEDDAGEGSQARRRLLREARAVASLNHPNIVTLYDVISWQGQDVLAMEFVDGDTLHHLIKMSGVFDVREASRIGRDVALALEHAHAHAIIHRDVKPSNIMLDREGRVRVMDFGLVKASVSTDSLDQSTRLAGTPSYMAPEQFAGASVDHRVDIYALGAVLYQLTTGRRPFVANDLDSLVKHVFFDSPEDPCAVNPELARSFAGLVCRCLAKDPRDRFPDAKKLATELDEVLRGLTPGREGPTERSEPPPTRG